MNKFLLVEDDGPQDWLDTFYSLLRVGLLLSVVFSYASTGTFLMHFCTGHFMKGVFQGLRRFVLNSNLQKSIFDLLTFNWFPNGFSQHILWFLENSRTGLKTLHIPQQFLFNYCSNIKVCETNNRFTRDSGISRPNIDYLRVIVKNINSLSNLYLKLEKLCWQSHKCHTYEQIWSLSQF